MRQSNRPRSGFTLLELLVVIGILAMLLAILMPAINTAQQQARQASCASNMGQIYKGLYSLRAQMGGKETAGAYANYTDIEMFMMTTWPAQLRSRANFTDTRVFKCPADDGTSASDATLFNLAIKVNDGNFNYLGYCLPLVEGALAEKRNITANSYELWMEDIMGGGDLDFNDLIVKVTSNTDGTYNIQLTKGSAGYKFDLIDTETGAILQKNFTNYTPTQKYAGTPTSYGVSWGMNPPRCYRNLGNANKVYMIEYITAVIDADRDIWTKQPFATPDGKTVRFARHRGFMNVTFGDGHVESRVPQQIDPSNSFNKTRLWNP